MGGKQVLGIREVQEANPAREFAKWLAQKDITANQISVTSILFAYLAALGFLVIPSTSPAMAPVPLVLAALFIQLRLLCKVFDGMVASEGGRDAGARGLFNDIPDRISDPVILAAAGYAITSVAWGSTLGWIAALLALMTAYIRTLSTSLGAPTSFVGPMARQNRMAVLTVAALLTAIEKYLWQHDYLLLLALAAIIIGSLLTAYNRTAQAYHYLENKS